MERYF